MKERSRERLAALLMEELLEQLGERESIKRMFADMTSAPMEELLESLIEEFEQVVEKHRLQILETKRTSKDKQWKKNAELPTDVSPAMDRVEVPRQSDLHHSVETKRSEEIAPPPAPIIDRPAPPSLPPRPSPPPKQAALKLDPSTIELPRPTIDVQIDIIPPKSRENDPGKPGKRDEKMMTGIEAPVSAPAEDPVAELRKLEELGRKVEQEYTAKLNTAAAQKQAVEHELQEALNIAASDETDRQSLLVVTNSSGGMKHKHLRTSYDFAEDEYAYLHAIAQVPEGEEPSKNPFMLEEKGIDARSFVFAYDYERMRFYLSKINPNVLNVSKTMVLLLGKQESLQLHGMHENIMNDLRGHGVLLPVEFGTVVRGPDDLCTKVDRRIDELRKALDDIRATTWWTLNLYVLDSRIASLVGTDANPNLRTRERDRESYSHPVQAKKYDIKLLERILQKEKKIAEAVHDGLKGIASRSDIDSIIGLGSGSSEDWKPILKASYEVNPSNLPRFFRAITDLQYHHILLELMLSLTGNRDQFSLKTR